MRESRVDYALVGGFAVALHGAPRGTIDVDIVLRITQQQFLAAEEAFKKLGLVSPLPVGAKEVFTFRKEYIQNRNLIAWPFYNPKKPSEQLDVIINQDLKDIEVETIRVHGVSVRIVSKKSLIAMKKKSGRKQDLEDVKALEGDFEK